MSYSARFICLLKKNSKHIYSSIAVAFGLTTAYTIIKERKGVHYALSTGLDLSDALAGTITDEQTLMTNKDLMRSKMEVYVTNLQGKIIKKFQELEPGAEFTVDKWERKEGGGGITCVTQDGSVFERAAVNVSVVTGTLPPAAVEQMRSRGKTSIPTGKALPFFACGISSVIHPKNPYVPTIHFNYRFFEIEVAPNKFESWFGGGTDLTPYYLDEQDAIHFHRTLKEACDKHDPSYYTKFKKWCDDYFLIPHRNERRGVGGIFFDDLEKTDQNEVFEFIQSCGNAVLPCYLPILKRNMIKGYGYREREWQLLRRGRYVEFNLVYDRGTKFGLNTPGARIESILVSLPATAKWTYKHEPEEGSEESKLTELLKNPKEWI